MRTHISGKYIVATLVESPGSPFEQNPTLFVSIHRVLVLLIKNGLNAVYSLPQTVNNSNTLSKSSTWTGSLSTLPFRLHVTMTTTTTATVGTVTTTSGTTVTIGNTTKL